MLFNIQKFSIHDGPGIRTTVFLKGCPLHCAWCANPESQSFDPEMYYDIKKCVKCMTCINNCPKQALSFEDDRLVWDKKKCVLCKTCEKNCFQKAIEFEGYEKSVDEIVEICLQDKDFYEESGGGVTISGGEGMSQPALTKELVQRLKKEGVHTAIETTGCVKSETFQELANEIDLLLFDTKHYNSEMHKKYTGVGNTLILENLAWATENGKEVLCRIPVIPGFNNALEDAKVFVELFNRLHISKVQLLPFHQFGQNKYGLLQRKYDYQDTPTMHPEDLKDYQQIFLDAKIDCFF
jgi:pyruvate formate lyase activating enzyme